MDKIRRLSATSGGAQRAASARYRELSQASRHARVRAGTAEAVFEGVTSTIGGFLLTQAIAQKRAGHTEQNT